MCYGQQVALTTLPGVGGQVSTSNLSAIYVHVCVGNQCTSKDCKCRQNWQSCIFRHMHSIPDMQYTSVGTYIIIIIIKKNLAKADIKIR